MAGHESTTLDLKLSGDLAPRTSFFARHRLTIDYGNNVHPFTLADLCFNIYDSLDAVAEAQAAPGMGIVPRLALQYYGELGDFSAFVFGSVSLKDNPDGEFLVQLQYNPKLREKINLFTRLESFTSAGKDGHNFTVERLRIGTEVVGYRVGFAGDFLFVGNKGEFGYNLGGFVEKEF